MHLVTDLTAQRRLRVVKMRGTKHNTGYLAMDFDEGRFRVTRAMSSRGDPMARPLVKTHIRGFDDDVLRGGIPQGHVVLVRGASGTMKSSLAYYVLYHNAVEGPPGLYVTPEQTAPGRPDNTAGPSHKAT